MRQSEGTLRAAALLLLLLGEVGVRFLYRSRTLSA